MLIRPTPLMQTHVLHTLDSFGLLFYLITLSRSDIDCFHEEDPPAFSTLEA